MCTPALALCGAVTPTALCPLLVVCSVVFRVHVNTAVRAVTLRLNVLGASVVGGWGERFLSVVALVSGDLHIRPCAPLWAWMAMTSSTHRCPHSATVV